MNVSPTIWDYSQSNINETLLLQSVQPNSSPKNKSNKFTSLFQDLKEGETIASKEKSLVFDFFSQLSVTANSNVKPTESNEEPHQKIQDLYNICSNLMTTLQKLQTKIQKMEEKGHQKSSFEKQSVVNVCENELQSVMTYQNQKIKQCKCEHSKDKQMVVNLFQAWNVRQKIQSYKQENDQLKKQIIRLEVGNQELKKSYKKIQSQNIKLRELLKQYQSFNKKLITQRQTDNKLQRNSSNKLLSQRQNPHNKSNNLQSQEQVQLSDAFKMRNYGQNHYYADTIHRNSSRVLKKQKSFDQVRKHNEGTKQASTFAEIPRKHEASHYKKEEKSYLKSFQQCKKVEPLTYFVGNVTPSGSKHQTDSTPSRHHLSFYGLKHKVNPYNEFGMKENQSPLKTNSIMTINRQIS